MQNWDNSKLKFKPIMWSGYYLTWIPPNGWVSFEEEAASEECILMISGMVWNILHSSMTHATTPRYADLDTSMNHHG